MCVYAIHWSGICSTSRYLYVCGCAKDETKLTIHNICYIIGVYTALLSKEYIRTHSQIFGRNPNKKTKLTEYQEAIKQTAA